MIALDHNEAILFRLLAGFFGRDRVIPHMSVLAVCSGELPQIRLGTQAGEFPAKDREEATRWAKKHKCLFTIVNTEDSPRMVLEFAPNISNVIDLRDLARRNTMKPLLKAVGVAYLTMDSKELALLTDPAAPLDFFHFLEDKVELAV